MLYNPIMTKKRWLTTKIEEALKTRRVTMLVGARQCGKTSSGYNSYDKYGAKTGSFKTNSNGVTTQYDKYGSKVGTFKTDSSGRTTHYDKYGRKVGSYR